MQSLHFGFAQEISPLILCLGAHSDDIEIGCGATIMRLVRELPHARFHWVVFSATHERAAEAKQSAQCFLKGAASTEIVIQDFRDGFFPYVGAEIKVFFEQLKLQLAPVLIFTHYRSDAHQDHRLINELTWNTFRDHLILEYEIPKYDGDLGNPNLYVPINEPMGLRKVDYLMKHFSTQRNRDWFTEETFTSLLRLRGIESHAPGNYAEAFYARKLVLFSGEMLV